jgi:uncharacterized membrane protein required for colicin V production
VIVTYIITLIVLSIVIGIFVAALGGTVGGAGDKFLGALVGISVGAIIASTAHYFIRSFSGGTDPAWLQKGETYQITSRGADKLQDYFKDVVNKMGVDMGFLKTVDPSGALQDKIKTLETQTGAHIDYDKLKEAIKMMKDQGISPDQIKDMINIQDYMSMPVQEINTGAGSAGQQSKKIVNDTINKLKGLQNNMPQPVDNDDQ